MNLHAKDPSRYKVEPLCKLFGVSKQAYYKHDDESSHKYMAQEEFVLQYIHGIREKDPGIGGMKLWYMYQREFGSSHPVGRDRFEDIVDKYCLKVRRRVRKPKTTDSTHGLPVYPNLIKDFIPTSPNQLWVSDITYITIWRPDGSYYFCYLSLILDAYTEEIVGWSLGPTLETTYPLRALRMALNRLDGSEVLIHHSDRGCQYASSDYVSLLRRHNISISMTESGNPKDNAQAERINNTLKNELLKGKVFMSMGEARTAILKAIDFYNNERPHMSIDMMTPSEAAHCVGELVKRWPSYRLIAIKNKLDEAQVMKKGLSLPASQQPPSGLRPPVGC